MSRQQERSNKEVIMYGNNRGTSFLIWVMIGGLVSGAVSILIASRASEKTKRQWMKKGNELVSSADTFANQAKSKVDEVVSQARTTMEDKSLLETLQDIRDIIKEAAAEAKGLAQDAVQQGKDVSSKAKSDLNKAVHS